MPGVSDLYVQARRALLDALDALDPHRDAVVLVGSQAIYLYTGDTDVPIATETKDSDIALDPSLIEDDPLLEDVMTQANFHRNLASGQPGEWLTSDGVPVDLLVPASLVAPAGSRGARIPPHSKHSSRKVEGLEAAVVDHHPMVVRALEAEDQRCHEINVASPASLLVAKAFKLFERVNNRSRVLDKDAHDLYRLARATETSAVIDGYQRLFEDRRSELVARQSLDYLRELFATPDSIGSMMAGRTEQGVGDPETVSAAVSVLITDLLTGLE